MQQVFLMVVTDCTSIASAILIGNAPQYSDLC